MSTLNIIKSAAISELLENMRKQSYDLSKVQEAFGSYPTIASGPAPSMPAAPKLRIPKGPVTDPNEKIPSDGFSPGLDAVTPVNPNANIEAINRLKNKDKGKTVAGQPAVIVNRPYIIPNPGIARVPGDNLATLEPRNAPYIIPNPVKTDYNAWFRNNKGGAYNAKSRADKAEMEKLKRLGAEYQKQYGEEFDLGSEEAKTRMMNLRRALKMPLR